MRFWTFIKLELIFYTTEWIPLLAIPVSIVFGVLRIMGEKGEVFQALAHIWVTLLICVGIGASKPLAAWSALALSLLELVAFFTV